MKTLPKELIPNLDELYKETCKFVEEHQGEKGYIDTQNDILDQIYAIVYDDEAGYGTEVRVLGVRYDKNFDTLEIAYAPIMSSIRIFYEDNSFKDEDNWYPIIYSDIVYYDYTLLRIAESIHEYVE